MPRVHELDEQIWLVSFLDFDLGSRAGSRVLSETSLTPYSGYMVYTTGIWGEPKCPGKSVNRWMNASGS